MDFPLIPVLATAAQAGYQFYQGRKQEKMAKNLKPSNYVPPSVKEMVSGSRMLANSTAMPGFGNALSRLRTSTANTVARASRSTTNSGRIAQAVADADAREKEVVKDLAVANESFKVNARQDLNRALGVQAGHERASFDAYNAAKSALTGASMANKFNAFSGLTENLVNLYALGEFGGDGEGMGSFFNRRNNSSRSPLFNPRFFSQRTSPYDV